MFCLKLYFSSFQVVIFFNILENIKFQSLKLRVSILLIDYMIVAFIKFLKNIDFDIFKILFFHKIDVS